ncbi:MAG: ABC transporter ATP-binding protein [Chloroflexi bacterium]|nr:ABC transporter ATP-binding protein [Chloroflexota bacterium]
MIEIRLEALAYVYRGGIRALDGVSLTVPAGQRLALIGQNGSGKTTLVRHLNGILRPTAGRVLLGGEDTARRTVAELARSVGLVYQNPDRQIFGSRVRSEVAFGPRNLRFGTDRLHTAVDAALAATGLTAEADTNPYDLGSSRRKLLALASVLAMETPVLVLDEPTTGQDEPGMAMVAGIVEAASAAGRTVIAISHDMRFVAESFERVVVMRLGRILLDGSPAEVFARRSWEPLQSTFVEPPLAAVVGDRLGLGSTPTDDDLVDAIVRRSPG